MKKLLLTLTALVVAASMTLTGCGSTGGDGADSSAAEAVSAAVEQTEFADLSDTSLFVYVGAAMKDPMTEIADAFKEETGCQVDLTFGNAAQIISQITTSNEGDIFVSGAESELAKLQESNMVTDSKQLVKHIPVIAVPEGNPAGIDSIESLGNGAKLVFGDSESTPIGKIADAVLEDAGLTDAANIVARTSTAPEMITALKSGEADAAILWKETAENKEGIEIVDVEEMADYIKVIPAATLSCSAEDAPVADFLAFLDSDTAHDIWTSYGYEIVE